MGLQTQMRELPFPTTQIPKHCQGIGPFDAEKIAQEFGSRPQPLKKPAPPKTPGVR